jgi:hypothetical protein
MIYSIRLFFVLVIVQFCGLGRSIAQGDLLLMPRRVIFEGAKRYEELNLANTGKDTARYVISLMHIRMKEDGSFEEISQPDSGENFADNYLRFFPHSVTLGPSESQVVKIQLVRTSELKPGEYRSHIYFRAEPNEVPASGKDPATDSGFAIRLIPVYGISIPVIIRVGESSAAANLSDLSLEVKDDSVPVLNMAFRRSGNMSLYGDVAVEYITPVGKTIPVGTVKGIAVYTPNHLRRMRMELDRRPGVDYRKGKLHIVYNTPAEARSIKIAETEMILH